MGWQYDDWKVVHDTKWEVKNVVIALTAILAVLVLIALELFYLCDVASRYERRIYQQTQQPAGVRVPDGKAELGVPAAPPGR
jgi:hypothetical protein